MTTPSQASVIANFPNQTLTPFATESVPPTFSSLQLLQLELNENAASVHSSRGGGQHGHLTLTIAPATYLAHVGVAFVVPPTPPANPVVPAAATAAQITELTRQHLELVKVFTLYHDTDRALVRLLLAACPPTYLLALRDPVYGYGPTTTLQMITHLVDTYGTRTLIDRNRNMQRMLAPWAPPTTLERLFEQLDAGARAEADGGTPIPDLQKALYGYNLINQTGLFPQGCREWRMLPAADQTYARFVTHFTTENRERLDSVPTTANAGYHGVALAVTTTPPQPDLHQLMKELLSLRESVGRLTSQTGPRAAATDAPRGYCWTHGSSRNVLHTSQTCKAKATGHIDTATAANPQGGSTKVWTTTRSTRPGTTPTPPS
jgi:hypothetical protein